MQIHFEKEDTNVVFRISDFDPKYEEVFKLCFYMKDVDTYFKRFPINTPYLDEIMTHYQANAHLMFDQVGYFKPVPWEEALFAFGNKIKVAGIDWWVTGSIAACIRGISLNPHDVDVMVASKDVARISDEFSEFIIEPIIDTNGWLTRDFGVIFLHARIDIASDPVPSLDDPEPIDCGPYARDHLEEVVWKGLPIKVPPIELTLNANRRRERLDRVKMIEQFLQS